MFNMTVNSIKMTYSNKLFFAMLIYIYIYIYYIYIYIYIYYSCHGNSKMTSIPPFKNYIIIYPAHEVYVMRTRNSDLGRRSPGSGRVLCRDYVPSRHIRSKWSRNSPWLVNSASLRCGMNRWPSGRVSASAYCGRWFDLQWWRSRCALLIRPNKVVIAVQCFACWCLRDILVMLILIWYWAMYEYTLFFQKAVTESDF